MYNLGGESKKVVREREFIRRDFKQERVEAFLQNHPLG
jgi:hypothetical protein